MTYKPGQFALGVTMLLFVFPALFIGGVQSFYVAKEGFVECASSTPPVGSIPFEGSLAGYSDGAFPVGLTCSWNMEDGSRSTTFEGDWAATFILYGSLLIAVGGGALLAWRNSSRNRANPVLRDRDR
jgi:hypothetical protein